MAVHIVQMIMRPTASALIRFSATALVAVAACSKPDTAAEDSAAMAVGSPASAVATSDTAMAGMDPSKTAGMDREPAKDADHEFLRKMSDHHEGLIIMMDAAMKRASSASAKADARKLHAKQHKERDRMIAIVKSRYAEEYDPMVMPDNQAMNDSLERQAGAQYDREMYRHLVMHHQQAVQMVDQFLPRLKNADVKSMAEKMRAEQQREIAEFERKARP